MGRILLLVLIIVAIWLLWKAFGPSSWKSRNNAEPPAIKGPDDDEEFLWNIDKQRFKERREKEARERAQREAEQRRRKERRPDDNPENPEGPELP
ncbi:hypothetical protein C3B44_01500 [Corynebacterium yudongzhengii]|uniref:Uncharacterized protein n=1 Tax=Corynebacterium yudongzhengii TaxID=2080740 RepID=A0A2U1T9N2_9CORY|nr:hypothetical protein [Corynebacterium yudongzhengii]AWB81177.1 hypothetical protein C3B44_01500 [Corynebacterium yudongzhengii]PWC02716.1 hypothetical protein DF222_00230 [Corynebacterium yudongzhengii]